MRRRPNWTNDLRRAIEDGRERPFGWGSWDCCKAAASAVAAMTGGAVDLCAPFRYSTRAGATRTMRAYLGRDAPIDDLLAAVARQRITGLGFEPVSCARAQRGDLVLARAATPWGDAPALAVVDLTGRVALTASHGGGWAGLPMETWLLAWRV